MRTFATICMIPYTFTAIILSFFVTILPSKSHNVAIFMNGSLVLPRRSSIQKGLQDPGILTVSKGIKIMLAF
jgi:hypothetical protein